jgi:hypothetical protein
MPRKAASTSTNPPPVAMPETASEQTINGADEALSARRASLRSHRISQDYEATGRQVLVTVPVQKPPKKSFVRVHPDAEYSEDFLLLEGVDETDRTFYLVSSDIAEVFGSAVRPVRLVTAITALGGIFLWPLRLPDGRAQTESWTRSALEIAERGRSEWVKLSSDMELRQYICMIADASLFGEPKWPTESFDTLLDLAFPEATVIKDANHSAVLRWLGRAR